MKRYFTTTALLCLGLFSGCTSLPLQTQTPSTIISKVLTAPSSLTLQPDFVSMGIDWVPVYNDPNVVGYEVSRSTSKEGNFSTIVRLNNRFIGHINDYDLSSNTLYYYRISAIGNEGSISPYLLAEAKTLPLLEAVSGAKARSELPRTIKLHWISHPYPSVKEYSILKNNPLKGSTWDEIARVNGRLTNEYVDANLEDEREYRYRVVAHTFDGAKSVPSEPLIAKTKKLPLEVAVIGATKDIPKTIELSYKYNGDVNISAFKIYRSGMAEGRYEAIAKVETNTTLFRDRIEKDGEVWFYKVVGVDEYGLEGLLQKLPTMGSSRPKPEKPVILASEVIGGKVVIKWKSPDNQAVKYIVSKEEKVGFLNWEEVIINNVGGNSLEDDKIKPEIEYRFSLRAVDEAGIVSDKSEVVSIIFDPKKKN